MIYEANLYKKEFLHACYLEDGVSRSCEHSSIVAEANPSFTIHFNFIKRAYICI